MTKTLKAEGTRSNCFPNRGGVLPIPLCMNPEKGLDPRVGCRGLDSPRRNNGRKAITSARPPVM